MNGMKDERGDGVSNRAVSESVPNISTVEIPAPTAASVKATSTASSVTKSKADKKLNTPDNITVANRLRVRITANAVAASIVKSVIFIRVSMRAYPFVEYCATLLGLSFRLGASETRSFLGPQARHKGRVCNRMS